MQNINEELKQAVNKDDLEKVKALLSAGANANLRIGHHRETLLHNAARSIEMVKVLVLGGADVDARTMYNETPLHFAAKRLNLKLIRGLLKYGAEVNALGSYRHTALNHVAKRQSNVDPEIVKELLKYGADINIENHERRSYDENPTYRSPLDNAVLGNLECAKLLIKFTLIRNINKDYQKIINLSPYKRYSNYSALTSYLDDCVSEILQMKTDVIEDGIPLYELVANNSNIHVRYNNQLSVKLSKIDYSLRYPIYNDVISEKLKLFAERIDLLNKLSTIQFYTILDVADQDAKKRKIILDQDSTYHVTKFLSNDSLSNFIVAFDDSNKCTFQSLSSSDNLEENETSMSSDAKRAKLDHF
ncbi:ankyrin repeat and SOCS box protein 2-like [Ctenocephalides felis]|uniref:ankyrin repeat and SOCS box protein 2-like n=1 Tax=Ctenocephalides felis TaxID=7515 RepID=UPI000E6E28D6|nr:ankyrin repeat and SOCS box protein 2-like [Ctenocephalides felis]